MMTIESAGDGVVRVTGRLDAAQAPAAEAFLASLAGRLTLDATALEYISSAGLSVLLKTQKRLTAAGGGLRLRGLSKPVRDVFAYSGFDQIFEIEPAA
jgi:anti-anti-sigma factor